MIKFAFVKKINKYNQEEKLFAIARNMEILPVFLGKVALVYNGKLINKIFIKKVHLGLKFGEISLPKKFKEMAKKKKKVKKIKKKRK